MEQIIECNNLTHYYGKRLIYENLSFTLTILTKSVNL